MGAHGQGCESVPESPENFVANVYENNVTVSWSIVENASSYILKRDGIEIYSGLNTLFYDVELSYGVSYEYSLYVIDDIGQTSIPVFLNIIVPTSIFVPDDYSTIQEAIDSSSNTDAIYVRPGTYHENLYWASRPVSIISTDGPENTIIDGNANDKVFRIHGVSNGGNTLSGFTIKNGSSTEHATAGGLHITESDIRLDNLIIKENKNADGHIFSGVSVVYSSTKFINCKIQNNEKGGIYIQDGQSTPYFHNVLFKGHTSRALQLKNTDVVIDSCEFIDNPGGGIWIERSGIDKSSSIHKTLFSRNGDSWWGGLYISGNSRDIEIDQCIFYDNYRPSGGADLYLNAGTPDNIGGINLKVKNTIFFKPDSNFYDNSAAIQSIYIEGNETIDSLVFINNLFFYPNEFGISEDTDHFIYINNFFDIDPQFCDADSNEFTVSNISPVLNNGDGGQNIGIYDVGCQRVMVYPGDTDNNGIVDEYDVLPIAIYFHESGQINDSIASFSWNPHLRFPFDSSYATYADANGDGIVDQQDVIGIGVNWANTHENTGNNHNSIIDDSTLLYQNMKELKIIYESLSGESDPIIAMRSLLEEILDNPIPSKFEVSQNYPNPFNSSTTIKFGIPKTTEVSLIIYNIMGQQVLSPIISKIYKPGTHYYTFQNVKLQSGVYFYQIVTEGQQFTNKMMLLK